MSFITSKLYQSSTLLTSITSNIGRLVLAPSVIQARNYAARKGTRARRMKKKVKVEVEKVAFIPHNLRKKQELLHLRPKLKFDDSAKSLPVDDVYVAMYYQMRKYPFIEAVDCHKETHHPDMYNKPDSNLYVSIELNMIAEKKTRFVENFRKIVAIPHKFNHGEDRTLIAFSKSNEDNLAAKEAGAQLTGGVELIKQIQSGQISLQDFQYVIAHPNILPELVQLRGLMKGKFPNPKHGTLDGDVVGAVNKYLNGINYYCKKDEYEKDFGLIETVIGTLDMNSKDLEENFAALVVSVEEMRPKRGGDFISRCLLWSPPSPEKFRLDHQVYIKSVGTEEVVEEEEDAGEIVAL